MESEDAKRNSLKAAKIAFQKLKTEWSKHPMDLDTCGQLLTELKVCYYSSVLLPVLMFILLKLLFILLFFHL